MTKYTLGLIESFDTESNTSFMYAETSHELVHCIRYMNNNTFTTSAQKIISSPWPDALATQIMARISGENGEISNYILKLTNSLLETDPLQSEDPPIEGVLVFAKTGVNEYDQIVTFTFVAGLSEAVTTFITKATEV